MKKLVLFLLGLSILLAAFPAVATAQQVQAGKSDPEKIGEAMAEIHALFQRMVVSSPAEHKAMLPGGEGGGEGGGEAGGMVLGAERRIIIAGKWAGVPKQMLLAVYVEAARILDSLTTSLTSYELKEFKMSVAVPPGLDITFVPKTKRPER